MRRWLFNPLTGASVPLIPPIGRERYRSAESMHLLAMKVIAAIASRATPLNGVDSDTARMI